MRRMGGFFIWLSFLFLSCMGEGIQRESLVESFMDEQDDNFKQKSQSFGDVRPELEFDLGDKEEEVGQAGLLMNNYQNHNLRIRFFYPDSWEIIESNNLEQGLIFVLGNFEMDDLFHPKNDEILVEGLRFLNGEGKNLEDWARDYKRSFETVSTIVFEQNEDFLRLTIELGEMPDDWEGDWLSGFSEEYYWPRNDEIFVFKAVVNIDDAIFLTEFERMMESFEFKEEDGNEH